MIKNCTKHFVYIAASFPCPKGYVKCHKSFCLENRFVCDGIQQCEHGEDEKHCGIVYEPWIEISNNITF